MTRQKKIVRKLLKQGSIRVIGRRMTDRGAAYVDDRSVILPYITNVHKFLICIHEIGHVVNQWSYNKMSRHRCEFLTEKWTLQQAKKYKIDKEYPKEYNNYIIQAKRYVVNCCQEDNKEIPYYVKKWIKCKPSIQHELYQK